MTQFKGFLPVLIFVSIFIVFILFFNNYSLVEERNQLKEYSEIVSSAVWGLDYENPEKFLQTICNSQNYSQLEIELIVGEKRTDFIKLFQTEINSIDRVFRDIGINRGRVLIETI